jgi:hypothetical protein
MYDKEGIETLTKTSFDIYNIQQDIEKLIGRMRKLES